ncbi:MAG TPA: hypothetical protein PLP56_07135 [Candidatus Omnitrophota bacterium]|nr:hypothetical protein [Candidatus Omnitrophota bacterium]
MEQEAFERESTARDHMRGIFRRRGIILATCGVTMLFAAVGLSLKIRTYSAQVKMLIQANKTIDSPFYRNISDFRPAEITMTQSEIVKSNPVIERVVRRLSLDKLALGYEKEYAAPLNDIVIDIKNAKTRRKILKMGPQEKEEFMFRKAVRDLKKRIKVEPVRDTDLFSITVSAFTAADAARIANVVSRSYCIFDLEQQLAELKQQYGEKHLSVMQLQNNIDKLDQRLTGESLPNIEAIGPASVKIIEQTVKPPEPTGKSRALILVLSFFVSVVFGTVLAFTFDYFDSTLKSPKELMSFLAMPYLGFVPLVRSIEVHSVAFVRKAVNAAGVLWSGIIALNAALILMNVDQTNPVFVIVSAGAYPAMLISGHVPGGLIVASFIMISLIAVVTLLVSQALGLLEKQAFKHRTALKDLNKTGMYVKAFKNIAQQIWTAVKGSERRSLLFTSALPQEGVSTVVSNLGRYLAASSGKKVLIIDANTSAPDIHKLFRLDNKTGLADVLGSDVSLQDAVRPVQEGLFVLTAGQAPRVSLELADSAPFSKLMEQAEKKYDIVLVDCANLKDHNDCASYASTAGGIILVVSEGKARREVIKASLAGLEQKKAKFIGALLNNRTFAIPSAIYERA